MIEIAHWSALAPLAYLALFRRGAPTGYWLIAAAFACSFAGDSVAALTGGSWAAEPYYLSAQFALFGLALLTRSAWALFPAILTYAGLGTLLYLGMVRYATPEQYGAFMRWWYPYQGTRLAAFGLFGWAAWRHAR